VAEEKTLVDRLVFLDDANIPADWETFYRLAHTLLHCHNPSWQVGRDWIN